MLLAYICGKLIKNLLIFTKHDGGAFAIVLHIRYITIPIGNAWKFLNTQNPKLKLVNTTLTSAWKHFCDAKVEN